MGRGDRRHQSVVDRRTLLKGAGALGTAGVVGLAGCAGGSGTVSIGMANSLTGSLDTFGERNQRGKQLALEDINEVGLRGGELEIVEEDTESQSGPGVSAAQRLVNQEDVPILVGAVSSGVSVAIYESVIQGTDVDQISQNSTSPDLTSFPGLTRMSPPGRAQAGAIAQLVADDGHDSVAVAYVNNAYGQGVASVFREEFDGSVEYFQSHSQEQSSYSDVVTAMDGSDADAWVFVTYQPEFTTMGQEAFDRGYQPPVYGADSVTGPDVLDQVPEDFLEGMKAVVPSAAITQDNYRNFAERFREEFDTDPTSWATYCYDAIVTAALAIEASEEATAEGIANETVKEVTRPGGEEVFTYQEAHDVLSDGGAGDVNYQGISGPVNLDENGDPEAFLQVLEVRDGEYVETGTIS
ncbi:ABC transporter substrate-binding protein [Halobacteriales archaeon SW_7_71_33]|nr:MAG: ABC transporter substrate-binding protein [Halobacteriales archaeon SW_7_71_33]